MRSFFSLITLLLLTIQVFGESYKYVNTETLNIREGAGKKFDIVEKVNIGDKVTIITESDNWTQIETENGTRGFVASKFLSITYDPKQNNKKDKSPWEALIVLGITGFAVYKIRNFFKGNSSTTSSSRIAIRETISKIEKASVLEKEKYYCKCCGADFKSIRDLTFNSCFKSTTKKHQLFEGQVGSKYYCKDCGQEFKNLKDLTFNSCFKSSTEKHQPYEGSIKAKYSCKNCGQEFKNLKDLTSNSCFKSPTKKHQPAR